MILVSVEMAAKHIKKNIKKCLKRVIAGAAEKVEGRGVGRSPMGGVPLTE